MNEQELNQLLNGITAKVLERTAALSAPTVSGLRSATVVLVPGVVPFPEKALERLKSECGEDLAFLTFGTPLPFDGVKTLDITDEHRGLATELVSVSVRVILLSPTLQTVRGIVKGDDSDILTYLFVRAILWEKQLGIYLDYMPRQFTKAGLPEGISEAIGELEKIRADMVYYPGEEADATEEAGTLITEQDVIDAYHSGRKKMAVRPDTLITPLARDRANEYGIEFGGEAF